MKLSLKGAVTGGIAGGLTGGWAGAGAGALGGLFSGDEAADAKSAYNRQLNDSIMLWNMQNAYNTPLQQRKRLEEAGYNPNLWYTQGNTGNSGTISQPTLSYSQGTNSPLNKILNALTVKSAKADTSSKELDNEYKQLQLDYLKAKIKALSTGKFGVSATKVLTPYDINKQQKAEQEIINRIYEEEHPFLSSVENMKNAPLIGSLIKPIYRLGELLGTGAFIGTRAHLRSKGYDY